MGHSCLSACATEHTAASRIEAKILCMIIWHYTYDDNFVRIREEGRIWPADIGIPDTLTPSTRHCTRIGQIRLWRPHSRATTTTRMNNSSNRQG